MSVYLVGHITVHDQRLWQQYIRGVAESLAPFEAEVLFRGDKVKVLSGNHSGENVVVIRFKDTDTLDGWFNSDSYQGLIPLRDNAADVTIITYEEQGD
jgi:uncharacterized protein (DUF1330 family)